jgi:hypothetical protein
VVADRFPIHNLYDLDSCIGCLGHHTIFKIKSQSETDGVRRNKDWSVLVNLILSVVFLLYIPMFIEANPMVLSSVYVDNFQMGIYS